MILFLISRIPVHCALHFKELTFRFNSNGSGRFLCFSLSIILGWLLLSTYVWLMFDFLPSSNRFFALLVADANADKASLLQKCFYWNREGGFQSNSIFCSYNHGTLFVLFVTFLVNFMWCRNFWKVMTFTE